MSIILINKKYFAVTTKKFRFPQVTEIIITEKIKKRKILYYKMEFVAFSKFYNYLTRIE